MLNISVSDLNTIQIREGMTARILLYVEEGKVKGNFSLLEDQIVGTMPSLLEFAELIRAKRIYSGSSGDGEPFTGRVVTYYEKGEEVSSEFLRDDLHIASLPNLIELLADAGYRVTPI